MRGFRFGLVGLSVLLASNAMSAQGPAYDIMLRGGTIYDGSGGAPYVGNVAITGDRIVCVGRCGETARQTVDARGLAVAPGFVNMLSWANESLIADGRGQSDIRQGVTLEVMGEGKSMGPWNATMKSNEAKRQGDIKYRVDWTSLGEYLSWLERKGISPNVASFVGATTVRVHELGEGDVDPTPEQLDRMRALVRQAMDEGAVGVGSSLIYAPANFAETPELTALVTEAAKCGGMYISHIRDEGPKLLEAIDELVEISEKSGAPESHLLFDGILRKIRTEEYVDVVVRIKRKTFEVLAAQKHLWAYYERVALQRGVQGGRNTGKPMTYGEAYQRLFPMAVEELG
jgi:N-acyl-D-amino-acid deacylase